MTPKHMNLNTWVDASLATISWRSAKHWLSVWSGAGLVPRADDKGQIFMGAGFVEKFPDGPALIDMLRDELLGLIRKGNAAVSEDPRLQLSQYAADQRAYMNHLNSFIESESRRERIALRAVEKWSIEERTDVEQLQLEVQQARNAATNANARVKALERERDELKRRLVNAPKKLAG